MYSGLYVYNNELNLDCAWEENIGESGRPGCKCEVDIG